MRSVSIFASPRRSAFVCAGDRIYDVSLPLDGIIAAARGHISFILHRPYGRRSQRRFFCFQGLDDHTRPLTGGGGAYVFPKRDTDEAKRRAQAANWPGHDEFFFTGISRRYDCVR